MAKKQIKPRQIKRRRKHKTGKCMNIHAFSKATKFTPGTRKIVYEGLKAGLPLPRVCELADIKIPTFHKWMKKGKKYKNKPIYRAFRKRINRIRVAVERDSLNIIRGVAKGGSDITETKITLHDSKPKEITRIKKKSQPTWQAAAWYLERRHKEEYGRFIDEQEKGRSVEESALEVKKAVDALFDSVPSKPEE